MRRSHLLLFAAALLLSGCTNEDRDDFFLFVILLCFGVVASVGSLAGSGLALAWAAMRKPRGFVNLALAIPCAVASMVLDGFTASYSSHGHGVDREDFFLIAMTAAPVCWLGATVIGIVLRPPAMPQPTAVELAYRGSYQAPAPAPPPVTVNRIVAGVVPTVMVLVAYFALLYFSLPEHVPTAPR